MHNMRCTPPAAQLEGLRTFDQHVRSSFSALTGLHPSDARWQQAARGFAHAGLGLRSTSADGSAAYLASLGGSLDLCSQLDPQFSLAEGLASPPAQSALSLYNQHIDQPRQLAVSSALGKRQKQLTQALDEAGWEALLAAASLTTRAVLLSEAQPGARAFLAAKPHGLTRLDGPLFVTELRHRLGITEAAEATWCPQCNGVLDPLSLHAGTCSAGGERTLRHHALRDVVCRLADRAGLQPEREKAGLLLPQRPEDTGSPVAGRRMFSCPASLAFRLQLT